MRPAKPRHLACTVCREKKAKCDGGLPCDRCYALGTECSYPSSTRYSYRVYEDTTNNEEDAAAAAAAAAAPAAAGEISVNNISSGIGGVYKEPSAASVRGPSGQIITLQNDKNELANEVSLLLKRNRNTSNSNKKPVLEWEDDGNETAATTNVNNKRSRNKKEDGELSKKITSIKRERVRESDDKNSSNSNNSNNSPLSSSSSSSSLSFSQMEGFRSSGASAAGGGGGGAAAAAASSSSFSFSTSSPSGSSFSPRSATSSSGSSPEENGRVVRRNVQQLATEVLLADISSAGFLMNVFTSRVLPNFSHTYALPQASSFLAALERPQSLAAAMQRDGALALACRASGHDSLAKKLTERMDHIALSVKENCAGTYEAFSSYALYYMLVASENAQK